jgi:hypothetical protein
MGVAHLQAGSLTGVSEEERKAQLTQALLFFKVRAGRGSAAGGQVAVGRRPQRRAAGLECERRTEQAAKQGAERGAQGSRGRRGKASRCCFSVQ